MALRPWRCISFAFFLAVKFNRKERKDLRKEKCLSNKKWN